MATTREIPDPYEAIDSDGLERLPAASKDEYVTFQTEELSGLCPVEYKNGNGVRDFYRLTVSFQPNVDDPVSVELKSLKLYLEQFQDKPISHEDVAAVIYDHLEELLNPEWLYVRNEPNIRGGIVTAVELGEIPRDVRLNPLDLKHHDA